VPEIRDIAEAIRKEHAELEVFIHGALCYAYSGQCLLSMVIGGRSGNRGMCAQPCRKQYELLSGEQDQYGRITNWTRAACTGRYLLSTRDLSVYPKLSEITAARVASLKIEGRMRSAEYVAIVTHIYIKALKAVRNGSFTPSSRDEISLALAFSRGFTTGYINGEGCQTVMGRDLPGRQGILIGIVQGRDNRKTISLKCPEIIPGKGDGLVCTGNHEEEGFVLKTEPVLKGNHIEMEGPSRCQPGDRVFLTSSADLGRSAGQILKNGEERFKNSIPLELVVVIGSGGDVRISGTAHLSTGRMVSDQCMLGPVFSPARTKPVTRDTVETLLRKTGGTLFAVQSLELTFPDGLFAPISVINEMRREIIGRFTRKILDSYRPSPEQSALLAERAPPFCTGSAGPKKGINLVKTTDLRIMVIVSDPQSLESAYHAGADLIFVEWFPGLAPSYHAEKRLGEILDTASGHPGFSDRIGIKLPRIIRRNELDYLYERLSLLEKSGLRHILVDGTGIAEAISRSFHTFSFSGYSGLNITNACSLSVFQEFDLLTLSVELSGAEVLDTMRNAVRNGLTTQVAVFVQGLIEAMVTEDRLAESCSSQGGPGRKLGLKDQKGLIFPVVQDPTGRTHIFNAAETSLIDQIPAIRKAALSTAIIDARWRGPEYTGQVTGIWKEASSLPDNPGSILRINELKEKLRLISHGGMTSATWKRGLSSSLP
jgi:putative protease